MFSFATSQAIALSQVKQGSQLASKATSNAAPRTRKPLLRRLFDALLRARMRRAEIEVEHHRRFYEGHTK
jgi:hypothetical protein